MLAGGIAGTVGAGALYDHRDSLASGVASICESVGRHSGNAIGEAAGLSGSDD